MRGEAGEHLASNPPYGYIKDPRDKKKWIVDEEAAKVVQRIFSLCIAGKGPMQIAKILTADRVLTVTAYHAKQKAGPCRKTFISGVPNLSPGYWSGGSTQAVP